MDGLRKSICIFAKNLIVFIASEISLWARMSVVGRLVCLS